MGAATPHHSLAVVPADRGAQLQQLGLLAGGAGWLAYTAAFSTLNHAHATLPACPFYALTGHPCPFCGGTRSFAATWRGDLPAALHLYPSGPLLFAATLAAVAALIVLLVMRRSVRVSLTPRTQARILEIGLGLLALQWALKLFWLGNT